MREGNERERERAREDCNDKINIVSLCSFMLFLVGTFYFIIGAVGGAIVILLLLIILSVCVILSLRSRRSKRNRCMFG